MASRIEKIDRGYAVITRDERGIATITICTSIENGRPKGVFARHVRPRQVHLDSAVRLVGAAEHTGQVTDQVVEVTKGGDGPVIIRAQRTLLRS